MIQKNKNASNAIIITVSERAKAIETAIYFRIENDNKLHRTNIITVFSKSSPKPMQVVQVRSSENGKLWVIDEYVNETYYTFIFRIVISIILLIIAVVAFIKEKWNS